MKKSHCTSTMHATTSVLLLGLTIAAATPADVQAQTRPATAGPQADEMTTRTPIVIVSGHTLPDGQRAGTLALGTNGSSMDVPFSVDSVDGERLRDQAGTTLQDALRNIPGAQADSGFNGAHTQFFILRGAVADSGTGSNRILRDGVRMSNYPYVPAFIDSVDVLRGPGSAVGVRSEPGGTVNLVTRQPTMVNAGAVLVSAGEHAAREYTADLNRILSVDHALAARIIVTRSDASQWRHVPDRLEAVKLGIAQGDGRRYRLRAGVEAINQSYRPDYGIPAVSGRPVAIPRDRQFGEPFGDSTTNNRIVDLHGDFAITDATRVAVDMTHLAAHSTSIKNLLNGSPLAGQSTGTYARVSAWEPDTERRIDSIAMSLTSKQELAGITHKLFLGLDRYKETLDQPALTVPGSDQPAHQCLRTRVRPRDRATGRPGVTAFAHERRSDLGRGIGPGPDRSCCLVTRGGPALYGPAVHVWRRGHAASGRVTLVAETGCAVPRVGTTHLVRQYRVRYVAKPGVVVIEPVAAFARFQANRNGLEIAVAERPVDGRYRPVSSAADQYDFGRSEHAGK